MPDTSKPQSRPYSRAEELASLERTRRANLRQSVWEASQHLSSQEIRDYVEAVLREIESDEP